MPRFASAVLVGDFFEKPEAIAAALSPIAAAGVTGHLVQVVDPAEETLPYAGRVEFREMAGPLTFPRRQDRNVARGLWRKASPPPRSRARSRAPPGLDLHRPSHRPLAAQPADAAAWLDRRREKPRLRPGTHAMSGILQASTFTTPWRSARWLLLPVIWWLLRFTPPRPQTLALPALRLLLDLVNREEQPDRTPWWLMLLAACHRRLGHPRRRASASIRRAMSPRSRERAAAARRRRRLGRRRGLGQAPGDDGGNTGRRPQAGRTGDASPRPRPELAPSQSRSAADAAAVAARAAALQPTALDPDRAGTPCRGSKPPSRTPMRLQVLWLTDGLDDGNAKDFAEGLARPCQGPGHGRSHRAGGIATAARACRTGHRRRPDQGHGPARRRSQPACGKGRRPCRPMAAALARPISSSPPPRPRPRLIELPLELRNEVQRIDIEGERNAAAIFLLDDRWRRKTVASCPAQSARSRPAVAVAALLRLARTRTLCRAGRASRCRRPQASASMPACRCWCSPISACCRGSARPWSQSWVNARRRALALCRPPPGRRARMTDSSPSPCAKAAARSAAP